MKRKLLTAHLLISSLALAAQNPACIAIQGGTDRAEVGTAAVFEMTDQLTIEAWVRPDITQPGPFGRLVDKFNFVDQKGYNLILNNGTLFMEVIDGNGQSRSLWSNADIQDGNWHHVAGSFSGTAISLYVDGAHDDITSFPATTISVSSNPLCIGNGYLPMAGYIDEVRIWNTVRTAAQIAQYKDSCFIGNEPGLVGYWRFDEGTGTTSQDLTGNGNDETLMSNAAWSTLTEFPGAGCAATSIVEQQADPIHIYPNPASDLLALSTGNIAVDAALIINTMGQVVRSVVLSGGQRALSLEGLPNGFYLVHLQQDGEPLLSKGFIKQ